MEIERGKRKRRRKEERRREERKKKERERRREKRGRGYIDGEGKRKKKKERKKGREGESERERKGEEEGGIERDMLVRFNPSFGGSLPRFQLPVAYPHFEGGERGKVEEGWKEKTTSGRKYENNYV
ncbi:MAG: hypothetical protein ACTS4U_00755 [Candidatus Hodgkinia cicadicola]